MTQREAVFSATINVLKQAGKELTGDIKTLISKDETSSVVQIVMQGFKAGTVEFKDNISNAGKLSDEKKLKSYVIGLVNNWFRKDVRLNGGTKYEAKNPGSRQGCGDEQMKALKALAAQFASDPAKLSTIQAAIAHRSAELAPAPKAIDISAIPAELAKSLGLISE